MFKGLLKDELDISSDSESEDQSEEVDKKAELVKIVIKRSSLSNNEDSEDKKRKLDEPDTSSLYCKNKPDINNSCEKDRKVNRNFTENQHGGKISEFINVNDHLHLSCNNWHSEKVGLELKLEKAIKVGDINLAEEITEKLTKSDFSARVKAATEAEQFVESRKKTENQKRAKKRVKLHWGFESKKRWETKSNM
uniref:Protein FAM204A n=1 Tax=Ciona savignyi TaxID=51511 RepID=H2YII8_CIOSA